MTPRPRLLAAALAVLAPLAVMSPTVSAQFTPAPYDPTATSTADEKAEIDWILELAPGENIPRAAEDFMRAVGVPSSERGDCRLAPDALHPGSPDGRCVERFEHSINGAWLRLTMTEAVAAAELAPIPGVTSSFRAVTVRAPADYWTPSGLEGVSVNGPQSVPTGYARIGATPGDYSDVDIAILDTGVDQFNDDLNVVGGFNCTFDGRGEDGWGIDDFGHATHVLGIAAAVDNERGVIGPAAGARGWSVPVLSQGYGSMASLLCGVDWVGAHADVIDVVNMSLGGGNLPSSCGSWDSLHNAFCAVAKMGVTFVVSAGNSATDAISSSPANYSESVVTVSALTDYDGLPGGLAPPPVGFPSGYQDDQMALFSNYGSVVDFAAPGVNILSTFPLNTEGWISGTSMAAPEVTGVIAAHIAECGVRGPEAVADVMTWSSQPGWTQIDGSYGGGVGPDQEPLVRFGAPCGAASDYA